VAVVSARASPLLITLRHGKQHPRRWAAGLRGPRLLQAHEQRDDVFLWRGRTLLQPFTTVGEDGNDVYTVVDDDTGEVRKATRPDPSVLSQ